jgi:signal peptidase II
MMRKNVPFLALILSLDVVDQISKAVVAGAVDLYRVVPVIPGFFNITRIHNSGAIFGILSGSGNLPIFLLLTGASLFALGFVIYYFIKTPSTDRFTKVALGLILAGALGNLTDRILRGYVIDFLDFYVGRHHWPFFNVADSCITIGALLLVVIFFRRKPECSPSS